MARLRLFRVAALLGRDALALVSSIRDHRQSWAARAAVIGVLAYVVSPLDLIPDVLMIFGILDDIAVVSFGLRWAERRTPPEVLDDHRGRVNRLFDRWFRRPSEPAREPRWTRN
ncbi:YkvA family protein [Tistrella mobilis]|uniref:DUF1232 domain-containing protein n=1 Tax=Tistrella mobilis TaxID=171437 RepID=A0A161R0C2_9PROT|nr:YkvA family protein [Tistrella mobilis]KYO50679.1 hypothetical protein AUP44_12020 [Tistrella mobilis]